MRPDSDDPFAELERLFDRMDERFGVDLDAGVAVDLVERDDAYVLTADLPGYDREDVDVSVAGDRLTVAAARDREERAADERYLRRERRHREVSRTVSLPGEVDADDASAEYDDGVLTVTLPKVDADDGGRTIEVT
jgi:HSP20 family protein